VADMKEQADSHGMCRHSTTRLAISAGESFFGRIAET
jgi:hypothetical protein